MSFVNESQSTQNLDNEWIFSTQTVETEVSTCYQFIKAFLGSRQKTGMVESSLL